jgi:hypothetical protein
MTTTELTELLKEHLRRATEEGGNATLDIAWIDGRGTPTGRSDYYRVYIWESDNRWGAFAPGRPRRIDVTFHAAKALGYRYSERRGALLRTGCGYSKEHDIAQGLAGLVDAALFSEGSYGWVTR